MNEDKHRGGYLSGDTPAKKLQPPKTGVKPMSGPTYELVRVQKELVEALLAQKDPQPVVLVGLERHDDGIELIFRTPELPKAQHGQEDTDAAISSEAQ